MIKFSLFFLIPLIYFIEEKNSCITSKSVNKHFDDDYGNIDDCSGEQWYERNVASIKEENPIQLIKPEGEEGKKYRRTECQIRIDKEGYDTIVITEIKEGQIVFYFKVNLEQGRRQLVNVNIFYGTKCKRTQMNLLVNLISVTSPEEEKRITKIKQFNDKGKIIFNPAIFPVNSGFEQISIQARFHTLAMKIPLLKSKTEASELVLEVLQSMMDLHLDDYDLDIFSLDTIGIKRENHKYRVIVAHEIVQYRNIIGIENIKTTLRLLQNLVNAEFVKNNLLGGYLIPENWLERKESLIIGTFYDQVEQFLTGTKSKVLHKTITNNVPKKGMFSFVSPS